VVGVVAAQLTAPGGGEEGEIVLTKVAQVLFSQGEEARILIIPVV